MLNGGKSVALLAVAAVIGQDEIVAQVGWIPRPRDEVVNVRAPLRDGALAFLVLAHHRRRILHFGVTAHPTAEWTAQQLREAFPWETAPRYLLRDRDTIFGPDFVKQVKAMGIKQVLGATVSLAASLYRARNRHAAPRVPGSRDRIQ